VTADRVAADRVVDCRGMRCPMPVISVSRAMALLTVDQVLEVVATDPAAEPDLQAWARMKGHEVLSVTRSGDVVRVTVRKVRAS
jgi:tRNA 2-thiouridine synthesizing protein A